MRSALSATMLLVISLALATSTITTPGASPAGAQQTQRPVQYLAAVMNAAKPASAPLPSPTPPVSSTFGLSADVYVNPRWIERQSGSPQPIQYLVLMDVTGSMSWDFNGYGTYDGTNNGPGYTVPNSIQGDVQCDSPNNPNPLNLPYTDRCLGGSNAAWHAAGERRVYVLKQALANMIDRMNSTDSMRLIAFSSAMAGSTEASNDWSSDKAMLKAAVAALGTYAADPYRTSGNASNAIALQKARDLLAAAPATAPNGERYKPVVVMLTDSVANVFLDGTVNTARDVCATLTEQQALQTASPCQVGVTADGKLRPISAMIDAATKIKTEHPNIELYAIGLAHLDGAGLPSVANDITYHYVATQPFHVESILNDIQFRSHRPSCVAAGGYNWVDSIDAAHLPDQSSFPDLSNTIVGYIYIYSPNLGMPLYQVPIRRDQATSKISLLLPPPDANHPDGGIAPGTYTMMAYVGYKGTDGISRVYYWLFNPNTLAGTKRRTLTIAPSGVGGSIVPMDPLFLDLPPDVHICP